MYFLSFLIPALKGCLKKSSTQCIIQNKKGTQIQNLMPSV